MNLLNDDILNNYLDGALDTKERTEVEKILKNSEADRKRFNALKLVHEKLSILKADEVSPGFNDKVMLRLKKKYARAKQQNYFIIAVAAVFVFICVAIVGYLIAGIISTAGQNESPQLIDIVNRSGKNIVTFTQKLFSGENLSIIGSVFSFAIIIAGYFFYEQQKRMKANLGR